VLWEGVDVGDGREEVLEGGWQTGVSRLGQVVLRTPKPQSRTVLALLGHLRSVGFAAAPCPIGAGFAPDGREQLGYIEGESPHPHAWSDDAAWRIGRLLRDLHDAAASFPWPVDAVWRPWFARALPGRDPVIGHGDLGPWNILARQGTPVAFIDWDNAGPVDAHWELAQVAWLNAHLYDDDVATRIGLAPVSDRARQLALVVDGYGLEPTARAGLVDKMIEFAIRSAREEAVDRAVGPDTASPADDGFPLLWAITWRARAAAWLLDHRVELQAAVAAGV
jgi:hypothetical protein